MRKGPGSAYDKWNRSVVICKLPLLVKWSGHVGALHSNKTPSPHTKDLKQFRCLYTNSTRNPTQFICVTNDHEYVPPQWPKEKVQQDKQRSRKHTHKAKDRVTRTPIKTGGEHRGSGKVKMLGKYHRLKHI
jgi:hypothetical protein